MNKELVVVIDFGGQYNQLVARRVRECNVYCEIYSYKTDLEKIKEAMKLFIGRHNFINFCANDDGDYIREIYSFTCEEKENIITVVNTVNSWEFDTDELAEKAEELYNFIQEMLKTKGGTYNESRIHQ